MEINRAVPNLINICVDKSDDTGLAGRFYHCYDREPREFSNVIQLLNEMEQFFDSILFPRSSTKMRYFVEPEKRSGSKPEKSVDSEEVLEHRGKKGSFAVCVKYRQNTEWQGELTCLETESHWRFASMLELIKLIHNTLL